MRVYLKLNKHTFMFGKQKLEWDGYNKESKIAFEYQGYQHYEYPNYYHKTKTVFLKAQERDKLKEQYAKDNNIKLIIIPFTANIE